MIRKITFLFIVSAILQTSCVERISFDVEIPSVYPVTIEGSITDQPGPYQIRVSKAFDVESKQSQKTPINVKSVKLFDSEGFTETLQKMDDGVYQTTDPELVGVVGRAYNIRVEMLDGRIYESIPDTLYQTGTVEDVFFEFKEELNAEGSTIYGFDVFFNSTTGSTSNPYFLWKFVGTYKVETNPELYTISCGESRCPSPLPCSGYILGPNGPYLVSECECCTCWVDFFNDLPIISDNQFVEDGTFLNVKAGYVPVNQWTFMHRVHAEVQQLSLSRRAFNFWKGVKDQKESSNSLFQPNSGKIRGNFVQVSGPAGPVEGLFYASSISRNSVYITRNDVKPQNLIPPQNLPFTDDCSKLFPYSRKTKPTYWED